MRHNATRMRATCHPPPYVDDIIGLLLLLPLQSPRFPSVPLLSEGTEIDSFTFSSKLNYM